MNSKDIIAGAVSIFLSAVASAQVNFTGVDAVTIVAEASTGLENIYVLPSTAGVRAAYADATAQWYKYSNLGGAYAERINSTTDAAGSSIALEAGDMGYIIESGGRQHAFWVVDYSKHELALNSLAITAESDCNTVSLALDGSASELYYYNLNGRRMTLSRELELSYNTLAFNEEAYGFSSESKTETLASAGSMIHVAAPLCDTQFTLSGDRFLKHWNKELQVVSPTYTAVAVACEGRATQQGESVDNEQKLEVAGLGGSAPCTVYFEGAVSDAAVFREWQISSMPEFDIPENTFTDIDFEYTFREQGTWYVRLTVADASGVCTAESQTFEVFIGDSKLLIPNAFTPHTSPGVNDEWKVSYRSLIEFECHVFNRGGTEMWSTKDPSQGWDGKYRGKFVPAGVYYYVITARGADGVRYKRSGDINIIDYKEGTGTAPAE